ncbi:alpha/beta fold hydrolase [Actinoplanes sp. NPDC051494]|uniref:alpha/beta fold hydrolase n=1 Tax=Actinoplanes sp. NPDC051494 TaxID=3363907 RepID=UPI0037B30EC3
MKFLRRPLRVLGALVALVLVAVVAIYAWPLRSDHLTHATAATLSFADARAKATAVVTADTADATVTPECRTKALVHEGRAAKAVLMLHGYTDCPAQFDALAKLFFDQGYNVFVPRAPRHGVTDQEAHAGLHADELVDYASDALTVTSGLGDDVGVVGLSGGGVLATWLAGYRPDVVAHLLVLSPFYAPAAGQAPSWQVKPLIVLYGNRLLPDHFNDHGFSYAALAQYLRIARTYPEDPQNPRLVSVGIVTSPNDTFIDLAKATEIPRDLALANDVTPLDHTIPADWNVGHDTVDPAGLGTHADELNKSYLNLYEGRAALTR